MVIGPIEPFVIDHESIADTYLDDLLKEPKYRSMDVIEQRANKHIKDARIRDYFITKGKEMVASA
jgi:hypothetical protein